MALKIDGKVNRPLDLDFEDLKEMPDQVEDVSVLVPKRAGAAVPLKSLLAEAAVQDGVRYLTVTSTDGTFAASIPLDAVLDSALVVYRSGEAPLPESKGGPFRFLIPDAASCHTAEIDTCANVKFVGSLSLSEKRGEDTRPTTPRNHKALHETPGHEHLEDG
jgi:DMSO/TMAO reductase YedYZ molybdopterin-dependent catalytic subunit